MAEKDDFRKMLSEYYNNPNLDPTSVPRFPVEPPKLPDQRPSLTNIRRPGDLGQEAQEGTAADLGTNLREGRGAGASGNLLDIAMAFLGAKAPGLNKRNLNALERAKQIKADPGSATTPGGRTEKAWKAGGQYGGWDELVDQMAKDPTTGKMVPQTGWYRYVPTFMPGEPAIKAFDATGRDYAPSERGWFGRRKKDTAEGTLGDLTNLNPEFTKSYPDIADIPLKLSRESGYNPNRAYYMPPNWLFNERMFARGYSDSELKDNLAHEIDHALAMRQGLPHGASPGNEARPWKGKWQAHQDYEAAGNEPRARLASKLEMNEPYRENYLAPANYPGLEFPRDPEGNPIPGKKGRMIDRDIKGERPREMPPSWQYDVEPEDMRNATSPGKAWLLNGLPNGVKWGGGFYGLSSLLGWLAHRGEAEQNDESKAFADRPTVHPDKSGQMEDYLKGQQKAAEDKASSAGTSLGVHGVLTGANALGSIMRGLSPVLRGANVVGLGWNGLGAGEAYSDRKAAQAEAERLRAAREAWAEIPLPNRDDSDSGWEQWPKP